MSVETRDLVILGSGPGGYVAAIRASQLGRKVTIVERENLGGVCLNWGCIPSKALLRSAQIYADIKHASEFGFKTGAVEIDFKKIVGRSRDVAGKLSGGVAYLMKKNKVEVVVGEGQLDSGNRLNVKTKTGTTTYTFKDIIIATGARARPIPGVEVDGEVIHTYRTALENVRQPQKLLVIGAGAIGMEFAHFFNTLGTEVTVVEMLPQILPVEDTEVATSLQKIFEKRGMKIQVGTAVSNLKKTGKKATATLTPQGGTPTEWEGDMVLVAIGVLPNTENIGLEKAGVTKTDRGFIKVNEYLETNVPHHYAIGDCAGNQLLAHKASHEGIVAAENMTGHRHAMKYDNIPGCTYCSPQVASIGKTEQQLKKEGAKYKVGKIPFSAIGKAIAIGEPDGFTKTLIDAETGEVLGVHILHAEATELIAEAVIIRTHEGIAESVVDSVHPHPTLSEVVGEAMAAALGRPVNF